MPGQRRVSVADFPRLLALHDKMAFSFSVASLYFNHGYGRTVLALCPQDTDSSCDRTVQSLVYPALHKGVILHG